MKELTTTSPFQIYGWMQEYNQQRYLKNNNLKQYIASNAFYSNIPVKIHSYLDSALRWLQALKASAEELRTYYTNCLIQQQTALIHNNEYNSQLIYISYS